MFSNNGKMIKVHDDAQHI